MCCCRYNVHILSSIQLDSYELVVVAIQVWSGLVWSGVTIAKQRARCWDIFYEMKVHPFRNEWSRRSPVNTNQDGARPQFSSGHTHVDFGWLVDGRACWVYLIRYLASCTYARSFVFMYPWSLHDQMKRWWILSLRQKLAIVARFWNSFCILEFLGLYSLHTHTCYVMSVCPSGLRLCCHLRFCR